jgi:hypothetical protein
MIRSPPTLHCFQLEEFYASKQVMDSFILKVLSTASKLKILNINMNVYLTKATLQHLIKKGENVSRLSVSLNSFITDDSIQELLPALPKLKSINLSGTSLSNCKIECKTLEKLYLNACEKLTEDSILYAFRNCPNLQAVEVNDLPMVSSTFLLQLQSEFSEVEILYK